MYVCLNYHIVWYLLEKYLLFNIKKDNSYDYYLIDYESMTYNFKLLIYKDIILQLLF